MNRNVKIIIVCILIAALIISGVVYLIHQTRDDELLIGEDRAEYLALRDSGLAESQVSGLKSTLKYHGGQWYYKVKFSTIALDYEYSVDAYSGAILDKNGGK